MPRAGFVDPAGGPLPPARAEDRWLDRLAAAWCVGVALTLFALLHARGFDDAYITYTYAVNLAEGRGFVFNPGERILATTTPLFTLLLAAASALGLDVPRTSTFLGCAALGLGGFAFWRLGRAWQSRVAGGVGLVLYPTHYLVVNTLSNEGSLYVALVLTAFWMAARGRHATAMGVSGLATLTRHDGVLAAGMVALHWLLLEAPRSTRRVRSAAGLALAFGAVVAPWALFAWSYFGSLLPSSLSAKQARDMLDPEGFAGLALVMLRAYVDLPRFWPHLLLMALGLAVLVAALVRCLRPALPGDPESSVVRPSLRRSPLAWGFVVGWGVIYFVAYWMLGVAAAHWYYAPLAPAFVASIGVGAQCVADLVRAHRPALERSRASWLAPAILLALLGWAHVPGLRVMARTNDERIELYRKTGEWLRENTPATASVGTLEIGVIGYYAQRRIIDFACLLQPELAQQIRLGTTYDDLASHAMQAYRPDYVAMLDGFAPRIRAGEAFRRACSRAVGIRAASHPGRMDIYACAWARAEGPRPDKGG